MQNELHIGSTQAALLQPHPVSAAAKHVFSEKLFGMGMRPQCSTCRRTIWAIWSRSSAWNTMNSSIRLMNSGRNCCRTCAAAESKI